MSASGAADRFRRAFARPEIALLFGLLAVYAATTNTRGLYHASLHQGVVKALVEQGTLYIRDYDPREPLGGDVFVHDGHVYANKQPGSFFLGAGVYRVLRLAGVTYDRDFYLTAALVAVFTSGLLTALTAIAVYRIARERASPGWATGTALAFGLGTSALPYAGALHHDVVATACLAFAYAARRRALLAGALLGLGLTSSLLPAAMIAAMAVVLAIAPLRTNPLRANPLRTNPLRANPSAGAAPAIAKRAAVIAAGIAIGVAPLLLTNWLALGAPWRMPLLTDGLWPESSPRFDPARAIALLVTYAKLLLWYAPIALVGWVGLAWGAVRRDDAGRASGPLLAIVTAQLLFVLTLGTDGACQYGPRLLLPTMPFACLGLLAFAGRPSVSDRAGSRIAGGVLIAVGAASFAINLVGALYGTMFCDVTHYAFLHYADAIRHRVFFSFPLLGFEGQAPY